MFLVGIVGCEKQPNAVGTYTGHYANSVETLCLSTNGTFSQTLSNSTGIVYSNNGTWSLEKDDLYFYSFIEAVDLTEGQLVKDKNKFILSPKKFTSVQGGFETPDVISLAPDTLYFLTRVSDSK